MKYFIDVDLHEYKKKSLFGKAVDVVELLGIEIVAEDGRRYYSKSKDFDLEVAWENEWVNQLLRTRLYGFVSKTNKQIAEEVKEFISRRNNYDWEIICWVYGSPASRSTGFPMMYSIDIKQESDIINNLKKEESIKTDNKTFIGGLLNRIGYLRQTNEHNALSDAKWNKALYEFLEIIK